MQRVIHKAKSNSRKKRIIGPERFSELIQMLPEVELVEEENTPRYSKNIYNIAGVTLVHECSPNLLTIPYENEKITLYGREKDINHLENLLKRKI